MSDSFIYELPLFTNPYDEKVLNIRFNMGCYLYNAILKEGLKRLILMKQSKLWKRAKKLPLKSQERNKEFKALFEKYNFSDYSLQSFAIKTKNRCEIKDHLDTHVCQKIATRVYLALKEYSKNKRGKPRFKRKGWMSSLEGKEKKAGIIFKEDHIYWKKLKLSIIFNYKDPYLAYALNFPIKYLRIVRKNIKGKYRYFIQFVLKGKPMPKKIAKGKVGLDIGPSTIASFSPSKAILTSFCEELKPLSISKKNILRKMDRSRRITNKDNYDEKKRVKSNVHVWVMSNRYKKQRFKLAEAHRKLKEYRKRLHGRLSNELLKLGNIFKTEKISYKRWQKIFGKSINFRAPSMFIKQLKRKAENAGGRMEEFSTQKTCLSQVCHNCSTKHKKPLWQRWHECSCKIPRVQRDLYSAYLSYHVEDNHLNIREAKRAFPGAHLLLEQAILRIDQTAIGRSRLASFGLSQS
ncbi:MAG: hypothetical protein BV456_13165 [Thermoplasmata archaeon M8B2D]|nr:MAG: hypothetical protein BV456_13165 [Thermoplasmata archaeon M8B2D]